MQDFFSSLINNTLFLDILVYYMPIAILALVFFIYISKKIKAFNQHIIQEIKNKKNSKKNKLADKITQMKIEKLEEELNEAVEIEKPFWLKEDYIRKKEEKELQEKKDFLSKINKFKND